MSPSTAPHPATTADRARPGRSRDPFFDNAKLLLVMLVVVGHSWVLMPDAPGNFPAYTFLYAWHVPAFVIVTGYLSRSFRFTRSHLRKLISAVAAPYLVFEALLALFRVVVGGESLGSSPLFLNPHWPMWYLAVLFTWRLATPLLLRMPQPMLVAVAVSLLGGLITSSVLDVSRATGLLPFFVLGLTATREQFDWLARPRVRVVAALALGLAFVAAVVVAESLSNEWLYWRASYDAMGVPLWQGLAGRAGMIAVGGALALSALALVPRSQRWFTPLGGASLVVYLCHGFFVKGAQYAGVRADRERRGDRLPPHHRRSGPARPGTLRLARGGAADKLVDPISTATQDTPGVLQPHHHRVAVEDRMALTQRHPTRQP